MFQFVDFYALLDIDSDATPDEINAAFNKEAKSWHPGRYPSRNGRKVMQDILDANRVLLDPMLKTSYDTEYFRLKASNKLPDPIIIQSSTSDIDVLLNELNISAEQYKVKRSAFGNKIIENPEPNVSDNQLLHVVNNAYSYKESFVQFAQKELLKRNYPQDFIDAAIGKSCHTNTEKHEKLTLAEKLLKFITRRE
jgi:curved DNA-binding protein CbpA